MPATITKNSIDWDQLLYQAVVDSEFRTELSNDPGAFGIADSLLLPDAVEQQDKTSLEFWTEGIAAVEVYACKNSCSWGPVTWVCDGDTK
jgi:hypothetical protein